MSFVSVQRTYAAATRREAEDLTQPHELILITLKTLRQNMDLMAQKAIDVELYAKSKSKSLTAIYILQTSLDLDQGGEIAKNLFQVYEYCRFQVMKSKRMEPQSNVTLCVNLLDELIDAWNMIK
jgi:flagellar secretion chaperone FliS